MDLEKGVVSKDSYNLGSTSTQEDKVSASGKTKTATPSTESRFDKNSSSGDYIYSNGGKDEYHAHDCKNN